MEGTGVDPSDKEALRWFTAAAEMGHPQVYEIDLNFDLNGRSGGNILVGQWGNVGRYLNSFGVPSKEFTLTHTFPLTLQRKFPTKTVSQFEISLN